jgi:ATP-dependent DNA helicase RecQ
VIVVTPLISLAEDQTDKLELAKVAATRIDSTLSAGELRQAETAVEGGRLELIYVTPERLHNREFLELARQVGCSLLVVDEAHCVSQWGHDFRPAYAALRFAVAALGRPPVLALTATATAPVQQDILEQLALNDPCVVRVSSARPNLHLAVRHAAEQKLPILEELLPNEGSGLVYTATIRTAREVFTHLLARDFPVGLYHGQLHPVVRRATQEAFMDGRYRIVVATKAFGMGIDKPNTRFVVHYQMPDSLESYAQESGRAGRDGRPARVTLLFDPKDERVQRYFLIHKQPPAKTVTAFLDWLAEQRSDAALNLDALERTVPERWRDVLCSDLSHLGYLERRGSTFVLPAALNLESARHGLQDKHAERAAADRARLKQMAEYASLGECRSAVLLRYFGDSPTAEHCDHCDNCEERQARVVHRHATPQGVARWENSHRGGK